jgi:hypothetical protein
MPAGAGVVEATEIGKKAADLIPPFAAPKTSMRNVGWNLRSATVSAWFRGKLEHF